MSYLRGDTYIWNSGDRFHLWATDGYDAWDEAGWAERDNLNSDARPSGVGINESIMDEFVVMRLAEMLETKSVESAIDRALAHGKGNGGCEALARKVAGIKSALRHLQ